MTHSYTNQPNFAPNFEQNCLIFPKIFLNLSQFWLKFGNILKNRPFHAPNSAFYNGSFIYQEADFATPPDHFLPRIGNPVPLHPYVNYKAPKCNIYKVGENIFISNFCSRFSLFWVELVQLSLTHFALTPSPLLHQSKLLQKLQQTVSCHMP